MQSIGMITFSPPSLLSPSPPSRNFHFRSLLKPLPRNPLAGPGPLHFNGQQNRATKFTPKARAVSASTKVKVVVTVKHSNGGVFTTPLGITNSAEDTAVDVLGKSILLELVSAELDKNTGKEKPTVKAYGRHVPASMKFEASFDVPDDFGAVGALLLENEYSKEMWVNTIVINGLSGEPVNIVCDSFCQPKTKRIFFTSKSYLPSTTPSGLLRLRLEELKNLRGDGKGTRKKGERIYDYDVYNDLGHPDSSADMKRPVLGGKQNPYPRRCRTGRSMSKADPASETFSASMYVPRDEDFSDVKRGSSGINLLSDALHAVVPQLQSSFPFNSDSFSSFTDIDNLFHAEKVSSNETLPQVLRTATSNLLRYDPPAPYKKDKQFWQSDFEFGRETLSGLNPCVIKLVETWPLKSDLDVASYGPAESAITAQIVLKEIGGTITIEEVIKQKKLFIIDYHDILLPVVPLVRQLKDTTLYGSRALFFLTSEGTLKPVAIELVRPPMSGKPQWKQVFTPSTDASLWKLAKAHFVAHDSGFHELISHWLRTHCVTEPYVIAAHRQLSAMHPIFRLLHPHFRYTMEINALARQILISAGGIIENTFSPMKYSSQLSSIVYGKQWRFDCEALPNDLIARGMAVPDASSPHGLKLTIEDYPFANDGLLIWDAIKNWVTFYVNYYYTDGALVQNDAELQAWWSEVRNVGHGDKKDEPWWPTLETASDLIGVVSTIIWVTSSHHAAVNFGQYHYGGYFPNRPSIARRNMPTEYSTDSNEYKQFRQNPDAWLLHTLPSQKQATVVMSVLDTLSVHAVDEEYIGCKEELAWADDLAVKSAFAKFHAALLEAEALIDARNRNAALKNRTIGGAAPYELLKPFSQPGVTSKGIPNSISI